MEQERVHGIAFLGNEGGVFERTAKVKLCFRIKGIPPKGGILLYN